MLNFNKIVPMRVYRVSDRFTIPYNRSSQTKGNLITVFGSSIDDTIELLSRDRLIHTEYYKRYYIDRIFKIKILNKQYRIVNDLKEVNENFVSKTKIPVTSPVTPELCKDFNTIYESGQYFSTIYNDEKLSAKPTRLKSMVYHDYMLQFMSKISSEFPNHNKYLFIPIDKYIPNPRDTTLWGANKIWWSNICVSFLRRLHSEWEMFKTKYGEWNIVLLNMNEIALIKLSELTEDFEKELPKLFLKFKSKRGAISMEDTVSDETIDAEIVSNDNEIKEVSKATVDNTISDLKISEKEKEVLKEKISSKVTKTIDKPVHKTIADTKSNSSSIPKANPSGENKKPTDKMVSGNILNRKEEKIIEPENIVEVQGVSKEDINKTTTEELKRELIKMSSPVSAPRMARMKQLQKDMIKLKVQDETIESLKAKAEQKSIPVTKIKAHVIDDEFKENKYMNFEKGYNKKLYEYDLTNILMSFAEKDRPLYLISLKKEDTSTALDKVYTYTCVFEDEKGKRHNLKFDMPKFVNDRFIHISGSDKLLLNQIIPLPITKVAPDEVQISSSYNKIFMTRFGRNVSSKVTRFLKSVDKVPPKYLKFNIGNNSSINNLYMTSIEYDELSSNYDDIFVVDSNTRFYLNQNKIKQVCDELKLVIPNDALPFGIINNKTLICIDPNKDKVIGTNLSPVDYLIQTISESYPQYKSEYNKLSGGSRMMYTRARVMKKYVPVGLFVAFLIGLEPMLNKLNIQYQFSETRPRLIGDDVNDLVMQFKDGYLRCKCPTFGNELFLNGFYDVPTKEYEFLQFSGKDIYYDIFQTMFGRRNIGNAFENFQQLFVDPITKEVLEDYHLPTDFIDIMIYANNLLESNTHDNDGYMGIERCRTNEMVNVHLYKVLSSAYEKYRLTADNKTPQKFSVTQRSVINDMFDSQILEEYSTLNPIYELDRMRASSYKGVGGCNVDRALKLNKRAFNDSMIGVMSQSSPVASNVGVARELSADPNITSLRGYIKPGSIKDSKKLEPKTMLSGTEMLVPLCPTHDDPQRIAMASTQSKHTLATIGSDPPLFGYGFDKVLPKLITDKFAFKAKKNGYVKEITDDYMLLSYEDGTSDVVDLTHKQELDTGMGFYVDTKLTPNFEVGKKFKQDEILARHADFFDYDTRYNDTVYKSGPLARVAVVHGSCVFEDSTLVTEEFAEKMGSYVTEKAKILLGKNSNIYHIAKVGDEVKVNDPLVIFDESYEDEYLGKLLGKISEEEKEDIYDSAKTRIKSSYNGEVISVKLWYTRPKEEYSESIQKIINKYEAPIKKRLAVFKENGINMKDLTYLNETIGPTEPVNGKVKGVKMNDNDILIEFYIKELDRFANGDKLTFSTALKGINQGLIPKGQEPYLASDPSIKIDAFMSLSGYYSRMTNSFPITMAMNTVLMGAEKKIADILKK